MVRDPPFLSASNAILESLSFQPYTDLILDVGARRHGGNAFARARKKDAVFKEEREDSLFEWTMLGNVAEGRPNLGSTTEVSVYRLMQFTLRDVLIKEVGAESADRIFYEAGKTAGTHFYKTLITRKDAPFHEFIEELQELLSSLRIGILRVEKADMEALKFTLTVAEDLDCSGLPVCGEEICTYDEGFFAGLLLAHTGREFRVKEVDCWCSGDRVCRFDVTPSWS
jgi:predicted hydrocarbon binding protein